MFLAGEEPISTTEMTTCAVVPIKELVNAKQRLAPVLDEKERQLLFQAMVEDVLSTLQSSEMIDECWVVTRDPAVEKLASSHQARVIPEPDTPGLIPAVTYAASKMAEEGVQRLVFVPGDAPLVSVEELNIVLTQLSEATADTEAGSDKNGIDLLHQAPTEKSFIIVPARDLGGSNCISCSPPDCMKFGFGEDSFRRHLAFARELGIKPRVAKLPGLGLDVDTPDDLIELISRLKAGKIDSYTWKYLRESGIAERFESKQRDSLDG